MCSERFGLQNTNMMFLQHWDLAYLTWAQVYLNTTWYVTGAFWPINDPVQLVACVTIAAAATNPLNTLPK